MKTHALLTTLLLFGCAEDSSGKMEELHEVSLPDITPIDVAPIRPPLLDEGIADAHCACADAALDAAPDATPDVILDATWDVAVDAEPDMGVDAAPPIDAAPDVAADAASPADAEPDTPIDAAPPIDAELDVVTVDAAPPIDAELDVVTVDAAPPIDAAPDVVVDAAPPIDATADASPDAGPHCDEAWSDEIVINESNDFTMGDQAAHFHDPGFPYGFFHTFDGLQAGGAGDAPRKVHVMLPRRYEEERQRRYPVVYINDGPTIFWDDGPYEGKTWNAGAHLSALTPCDIEPVILVAIYPLDGGREYTHEAWSSDPEAECCRVVGYAGYVAETLKPFIDTHYRTQPGRGLVLGAAHGGLAAFITAALHPSVFSQAAALSPSFWAGVDMDARASEAALADSGLLDLVRGGLSGLSKPKLWIDWGLVRDGQPHNDELEARVQARAEEMRDLLIDDFGYEASSLRAYADPEGVHEEVSWGARLRLVLPFFYPPL